MRFLLKLVLAVKIGWQKIQQWCILDLNQWLQRGGQGSAGGEGIFLCLFSIRILNKLT